MVTERTWIHGLATGFAILAATAGTACDAPLLPADYSGPPADTVNGSVLPRAGGSSAGDAPGDASEPRRPRMSLEWLSMAAGSSTPAAEPLGQNVSFRKTGGLEESTVELELQAPVEGARFQAAGPTEARLAVGKVAYYDDRNGNGDLDWACDAASCDVLRSLSHEFVVYVEQPPACRMFIGADQPGRGKTVDPGYHYYRLDAEGSIVEVEAGQALSFELTDVAPASVNPAPALADFAARLVAGWEASRLDCR